MLKHVSESPVFRAYSRSTPRANWLLRCGSWSTMGKQATVAEPDPNNPPAEAGVYNVKSGSEATALDGAEYSD